MTTKELRALITMAPPASGQRRAAIYHAARSAPFPEAWEFVHQYRREFWPLTDEEVKRFQEEKAVPLSNPVLTITVLGWEINRGFARPREYAQEPYMLERPGGLFPIMLRLSDRLLRLWVPECGITRLDGEIAEINSVPVVPRLIKSGTRLECRLSGDELQRVMA